MAGKQPRFTRKVYQCWAIELPGGDLLKWSGAPQFFSRRSLAVIAARFGDIGEVVAPVRVTVERIAAKKGRK